MGSRRRPPAPFFSSRAASMRSTRPVWGIVFEKTHSRWGKSRPWFLWLCVPFAVSGVLTFVTPNVGPTAKIVYAACTYVICSILYTGINTPVTAILAALTPDSHERVVADELPHVRLEAWRPVRQPDGAWLVARLGHGNDRRGFMLVMPMYAVGTVVLYLVAFRNLRRSRRRAQSTDIRQGESSRAQRQCALAHHLSQQPLFLDCIHRAHLVGAILLQVRPASRGPDLDCEQPGRRLAGEHPASAGLLQPDLEAQCLGAWAGGLRGCTVGSSLRSRQLSRFRWL